MKTKRVTYYVQLRPDWHLSQFQPTVFDFVPQRLQEDRGGNIFKIEVDLPEVPQLETITATVKEITP